MSRITAAIERIRYRSKLTSQLEELLGGLTYTLPIIETEEEQQLRQRPDYSDLQIQFYGLPEPVDLMVDCDEISYTISEISVNEYTGFTYKAQRIVSRTNFQGTVNMKLDFRNQKIPPMDFHNHPQWEEMDVRVDYAQYQTELDIYVPYTELEDLLMAIFRFNQLFAHTWAMPNNLEELKADTQKWRIFNQFKEQAR